MSLHCAHAHTQVTSVDRKQLDHYCFYVKPVDSMPLCKRCSNSVSAHMKDNMAKESSLSMTHLCTHTSTSNITLDILNAFKVITPSMKTFFPLVLVLVIHVWIL